MAFHLLIANFSYLQYYLNSHESFFSKHTSTCSAMSANLSNGLTTTPRRMQFSDISRYSLYEIWYEARATGSSGIGNTTRMLIIQTTSIDSFVITWIALTALSLLVCPGLHFDHQEPYVSARFLRQDGTTAFSFDARYLHIASA